MAVQNEIGDGARSSSGCEGEDTRRQDFQDHQSHVAIEYSPDRVAAHIGAQLAYQRRKARLTQLELSSQTGIGQAVISRIEHGQGNPTVSSLQTIAAALGLHITLVPNDTDEVAGL